MRCIVVPVNFTPRSMNAARYAADLAVVLGADLRLVYVLHLPENEPLVPSVIDEIRHSGLESLNSLANELRRRTGAKVKVSTDQQTGETGQKIQVFCKQMRPFLVVAGGPVDGRLPYPVLIVPENASFHPIHMVAVACDRNDVLSGMADQMSLLMELNNRLGCQFELIHIVRNGEGSVSRLILEYAEWKSRPAFFPPKLHFIRQDVPQLGLSEYLQTHNADWVMVLPKAHGWIEFHESQAKSILKASKLPVISLQEL